MVTYPILLGSTPCHLGGRRPWFVCPGPSENLRCGSRRRVLYRPFKAQRFACVACHRLHYRDPWSRLADAAMEALGDATRTPEGRRALRKTWRVPRKRRRK